MECEMIKFVALAFGVILGLVCFAIGYVTALATAKPRIEKCESYDDIVRREG